MITIKISLNLWDLKNEEVKKYQDHLFTEKALDPFEQATLMHYTQSKVEQIVRIAVQNKFPLSQQETAFANIMYSIPFYLITSEFNVYEKFKNLFDAHGIKADIYIRCDINPLDLTDIEVHMLYVDNGTGFTNYLNEKESELGKKLRDDTGKVDYRKIIDPNFEPDRTDNSYKFNISGKVKSNKTQPDKKKQTGGRGLGLRADALLSHAGGGKFYISDLSDFKNYNKELFLYMSDEKSILPERGGVLIYQSRGFSEDFYNEFKKNNTKRISRKGSMEESYYAFMIKNIKQNETENAFLLENDLKDDFLINIPSNDTTIISLEDPDFLSPKTLDEITFSLDNLVSPTASDEMISPSIPENVVSPTSFEEITSPSIPKSVVSPTILAEVFSPSLTNDLRADSSLIFPATNSGLLLDNKTETTQPSETSSCQGSASSLANTDTSPYSTLSPTSFNYKNRSMEMLDSKTVTEKLEKRIKDIKNGHYYFWNTHKKKNEVFFLKLIQYRIAQEQAEQSATSIRQIIKGTSFDYPHIYKNLGHRTKQLLEPLLTPTIPRRSLYKNK
ncbi:MAG: hypothetical protein JO131_09570 [Gammaproteobacteria bacterium]|nr:hypothetical protein [Gammaproteobacteria bacterium]